MDSERPTIRATEVGEYIRHNSCQRRFKLEINDRELATALPFARRLFNSLDPVLEETGRTRENDWEESLKVSGLTDLTSYGSRTGKDRSTPWQSLAKQISSLAPGQRGYGREVSIRVNLGAFAVDGRIDFVLVLWNGQEPRLRLVECKASRRDRTYQRIQVAIYRMLLCELLAIEPLTVGSVPIGPDQIECVVARMDESTSESQAILELEPLDLETEEADARRLLAADGALARICGSDLSELDYQLDVKCDGCVFSVNCLPESARQRQLELLGIEPSTVRALEHASISTIDDLAILDLTGPQAAEVRGVPGFTESLEMLKVKAAARRRTLPGGDLDPDSHEVESLPHTGQGQLPEHAIDDHRLIRVYLSVDYDYVENRIGALAAHITKSERQLHTGFIQENDKRRPNPTVRERWESGRDSDNRPTYEEGDLLGKEVIRLKSTQWTGKYNEDTGSERELIQGFLWELVDAIAEVAESEEAPIHFYVWSRSEMTHLVEACSRVGSQLLSHLRELLGCRESLEQLIYSCLQDEVDRRYALGWTGRGLAVITSLRWYGRTFHWRRRVAGSELDLERVFTQDIFDFKTDLDLRADGSWVDGPSDRALRHKFEIRSRFHDSLTAPYWRALWRTLPRPDQPGLPADVKHAIERYNGAAARPAYLREYLRARTHALRWVEEGVRFKNPDIIKPLMRIAELPDFSLGVSNVGRASVDFLRLDHHVKVTDWIASHLVPPAYRVPIGRTIPVRNVRSQGNNVLTAVIDVDGYDVDTHTLSTRSAISDGSFVRLVPCDADPHRGQTLGQLVRGGKTCRVTGIDWETGQIALTALWMTGSRYLLPSSGGNEVGDVFEHATVDESISDLVAGTVDERLNAGRGTHVFQWLDPESPRVPAQSAPTAQQIQDYEDLLDSLTLPSGRRLSDDQKSAAIEGLLTRVQLLLGPPGTGKTTTAAVSSLLRVLARRSVGDVLLIAANTHTAVNNLLQRIDGLLDAFASASAETGLAMPSITLMKVHSSEIDPEASPGGRILGIRSSPCVTEISRRRQTSVVIIGGTTNAILKMARELSERRPFRNSPDGFQVPALVVDEASMMVFPHFLALASLVRPDGEIMLTGDHRQLAPIVAHDWEREDRPPAVLYQPFASAYQAVQSIKQNHPSILDGAVRRSALRFTFRLPPLIRDLIARLYRLDDVELEGFTRDGGTPQAEWEGGPWESVWQGATGLYLILHSERQSKQSNEVETHIIEQVLDAAPHLPPSSIAIVTPHRAQRSLLKLSLAGYLPVVDVIDTVERLQGGERPVVIVSATASDPPAISASAEFILDLNRSNVAFSRTQDRLVVVCSDALLDHIPAETEDYESAMLWKSLRGLCSRLVAVETVDGHEVRILTPPIESHA